MAYKKIITLDFLHAYYVNERSSKYAFRAEDSLEIIPAPETAVLMQRQGIRTNKEAVNSLALYADVEKSTADATKKQLKKPLKDGQKLVFFIFVKNWDYLFYSNIGTAQEANKCLFFTNIKDDGTINATFNQLDIVWNDNTIALNRSQNLTLEVPDATTVLKKKHSTTEIAPTPIQTASCANKKATFNMNNAPPGIYALQTKGKVDDKSAFYYCEAPTPPFAVVELVWKNEANNILDDTDKKYTLKFNAVESSLVYKIKLKKQSGILAKAAFPQNITIKTSTSIVFPKVVAGSEEVELKSETTLLFRENKLPVLTLTYEEEGSAGKIKTIEKNIPLPQAKDIIKTDAGLVATLFIHQ
jgi:hypothetical protein